MRTNHVDKYLEAYLDRQLSPVVQQQVEQHLNHCPACARQLAQAERVQRELRPALQAALGQPSLPPQLRAAVKSALEQQHPPRRLSLGWGVTGWLLNAAGTVAVVVILAVGVYGVLRGQIPGVTAVYNAPQTLRSMAGGVDNTPTPAVTSTPTAPTPVANSRKSAGDTLPAVASTPIGVATVAPLAANSQKVTTAPLPESSSAAARPALPGGTIAYALFADNMYQLHLVNPNGSHHRLFPQAGVSEPALHPAQNNIPLAFRSWNDPDGPRTLVSSDMDGQNPASITHFWEDAQPDWSPTENRLIFASQRESDRKWRLYSVWGDASLEVNLRREGKSPTFAPDGLRFAFESCDEAGNRCGLWVDDLNNSEFGAQPVVEDKYLKAPDWSPVDETIAYMANPNDNWDLYLVDSNGHNLRRLTDDPAIDGLPAWSPDGKWLAFVSNRGGTWGIWLINVDSGQLYQTISFKNGALTPPERLPYSQHGPRNWWDEQISWGN